MNKARESTSRVWAMRSMALVSSHYRQASPHLLYSNRTCFVACSSMTPAEAAYRNAQYDLLGIQARWIRDSAACKRKAPSPQVYDNLLE